MEHYLGVARKEGISDEEIGAMQSIVMAVCAGRIHAQFKEVEACVRKDPSQERNE